MFWVRFKDSPNGAYTTVALTPGPTSVDYPPKRAFTVMTTQDGASVIQRPLRDSRSRKWVWTGYKSSALFAAYENQWQQLLALEYRTRLRAGKYPLVEIWEDTVPEGGFNRVDGNGDKLWTTVRFIQVDRTPRKGGGQLVYDESTIEFVIDDTTYDAF